MKHTWNDSCPICFKKLIHFVIYRSSVTLTRGGKVHCWQSILCSNHCYKAMYYDYDFAFEYLSVGPFCIKRMANGISINKWVVINDIISPICELDKDFSFEKFLTEDYIKKVIAIS